MNIVRVTPPFGTKMHEFLQEIFLTYLNVVLQPCVKYGGLLLMPKKKFRVCLSLAKFAFTYDGVLPLSSLH